MKKMFFMLLCAVSMASCVVMPDLYVTPVNTSAYEEVKIEASETKAKAVIQYGDTIAKLNYTTTIGIAKTAPYRVVNIGAMKGDSEKQRGYHLMFEDLPYGDHDYNDLVIHVDEHIKHNKQKCEIKMGIKSVALGSIKDIHLGFDFGGKTHILLGTARSVLFKGAKGFINTDLNIKHSNSNEVVVVLKDCDSSKLQVSWFIVVDGTKYYAEATDGKLTEGVRPYGLLLPKEKANGGNWKDVEYPYECMNIDSLYPDFQKWLMGEVLDFRLNKVEKYQYKKSN